jgi:hypothetical protein
VRPLVCVLSRAQFTGPKHHSGADHYGLYDATYTAGVLARRGSPTQKSPKRRPTRKAEEPRSKSVDQLILGSPKLGPTSSDSKGLHFESWREGEREGREWLICSAVVCHVIFF